MPTAGSPPPAPRHAPHRRRLASVAGAVVLAMAAALGGVPIAPPALAAGETVTIHLTTTSDSGGRNVTRGLERQAPVNFAATSPGADHTIAVDEGVRYQRFEGGGASITDTTAHLFRGGAISAATRDAVMRRLFDPVDGIGLSFVRNPIGASDLSRPGMVSLDDTCCDLNDFGANGYDTNVRLLTQQAKQLNPQLRVMGVPWSAPGWMKDNGRMDQMGWLKWEYYPTYAQYLAKYVQSYQAAGVPVDYISVQNEPNCCQAGNPTAMNYPGMSWNPSGLVEFTKNHVYPAFRAAGIGTKVIHFDWNYGDYASFGSQIVADAALRTDPLSAGIGWHDYAGSPSVGTQAHDQYPSMTQFNTEHSGGTWVGNQHNEDMGDIIEHARNWSSAEVKWSLALNQNMGPHNGGCGTCTGLVTVQEGGGRAGQVDNTVEYYTMGHLTKFVKPGAYRILSTADSTVQNVAYVNPDGSKALLAHNGGGSARSVRVVWGGQSFTYDLPARTTATFTWSGTQSGGGGAGQVTGLAGKCMDVARRRHGERHGRPAPHVQRHRRPAVEPGCRRNPEGARQVPGRGRSQHRGRRPDAPVGLPRRLVPAMDVHVRPRPGERLLRQVPGRDRQQLRRRDPAPDLDLHRRRQPEVDRPGVARAPGGGTARPGSPARP
ncbi:hypothetical protein LUX32_24470 [Actinomadura madurae]|nr:glycoside hydrolase family 30 beta sandwich domain-containing protein [Actinomadura madurae]MCP9980406.1 hypothetical protein [Actinomadura madurae]